MTEPPGADGPGDALDRLLLGGPRSYTRQQVAAASGVPMERAQQLWRALGFPDVSDDEVAFTDADVDALRLLDALAERGLVDAQTEVAMTRAMGQSLARLAEWQVAALAEALPTEAAETTAPNADLAGDLLPVMEGLISYVWRRHLAATARRLVSGTASDDTAQLVVGFADLVGYTALTRQIDEAQLAATIDRFEGLTADVVATLGGRVVKTLGDEVMFSADEAAVGAEIALELIDRVGADEQLPDIRVGLACGPVLARLGDLYGEPVNLASRLTSIARPGSVLVERQLATELEDDDRYRVRRTPPRPVRGYTLVHSFRLRRGADD